MKHKRIPISKSNATYQILQSIKENRKKRRQHNEILVEGIESIKQLFQSSFEVKRILFKDYESLSQWAKDRILEYPRSELLELSPELYHNLADKEEPAEIMVTTVFPVTDLSQISLTSNPLILILDRPGNYGNLGSILRSANSFAVDLVLITGHGVDPWDPRVIRSSLGAIFYTPLIPLESHQQLIDFLEPLRKKLGLRVLGTDSQGDISLNNHALKRPLALVMGNEAKGISRNIQEMVDGVVSIPLKGQVNSLNLACATTVLLYLVE